MTDKWKQAEDEAKKGGVGGDFLKLEDGDTVTFAVLGEPETYTAKPFKEGGAPSSKVLLNVFVTDPKPAALKVWDMSAPTFRDLIAVRAKFPFEKWLYSLTRSGTGKSTRYKVLPDIEKPLSPEQQAHLRSLELRDLEELAAKIEYEGGEDETPAPSRAPIAAPAGNAPPIKDDDLPF